MVTKFSRIVLMLVVIFVLSIVIPEYYWMAFEKKHSAPTIIYSSLVHDFLYFKRHNNKVERFDNKGRKIGKKKFERLAPLYFYRTLYYLGVMPDSIGNYKVDYKELKRNSIYTQIKPEMIQTPQIMLFPLIESVPDGPKLEMPDDFFRITKKMEFIDCEQNKIIPELTEKFTRKLKENGFSFPAEKIFGNPSVMKPFDEGYFVLDSKNKLFHIKRVHNNPFVKKVPLPEGVVPVFINVTEMELREFYGILIDEKSDVYLISYDNYKFIKLPVENYDYRTMKFKLQGTVLTRTLTVSSDTSVAVFVTDRNYNLIATRFESWHDKYETTAGKIIRATFPFSLELTSPYATYVDFYFHFSGVLALIGIIFSLIVYIVVQKKKGEEASQCKLDYVIIALTGVYGLIAALLIRDETWKI